MLEALLAGGTGHDILLRSESLLGFLSFLLKVPALDHLPF